ncbi:MAG: ABC transporter permease [Lachnospiraceae bacterium]|nr:ABC transporter permease [Lachnospiraceae bacterium]
MKSLIAFIKKEVLEQIRSGRVMILGILFVLFGIMNPAVAKLTPWLLEAMADSLAETGMIVTDVTVSAMDSWVQFFKNIPMALIAFVLLESSIFTREYQTGTLVLFLTKGLERYKVVVSKTVALTVLWTLGYWLCFGITYGYNAYFWDNSVAHNLMFSVVCWWLFGLWVIALLILISAIANSNTGVLTVTGGVVLASYLLGFLPKLKEYVPTMLADGNTLIYGTAGKENYMVSLAVTVVVSIVCFVISILIFNRKQL